MNFGIDRLLADPALRAPLQGKRVALLAHPASVTADLTHSLDALKAVGGLRVTAAFGPQHGMRGDKQDNMVETEDFTDPLHGIPVFSLYGQVRRPSGQSMGTFDVILVDMQDLGCRIYTFITTLLVRAGGGGGARQGGVGAGPAQPGGAAGGGADAAAGAGELRRGGADADAARADAGRARAVVHRPGKLDVDYRVIEMEGYRPDEGPGFGWPLGERSWINPSPNAANLWMARAYAGTVMLEGTTLSRGGGRRGRWSCSGRPTSTPRRCWRRCGGSAPQWLEGCRLRDCWFQPTFHKHVGQLCSGVQIHVDDGAYDHAAFKPWRVQTLAFKAIRRLYPDYPLWRDFPYEYELERLAIDVINGGPGLREWVDDAGAEPGDLDALTVPDEQAWVEERRPYLLY
jgi:uncharacterized protein YbbC (DUF1343 family)